MIGSSSPGRPDSMRHPCSSCAVTSGPRSRECARRCAWCATCARSSACRRRSASHGAERTSMRSQAEVTGEQRDRTVATVRPAISRSSSTGDSVLISSRARPGPCAAPAPGCRRCSRARRRAGGSRSAERTPRGPWSGSRPGRAGAAGARPAAPRRSPAAAHRPARPGACRAPRRTCRGSAARAWPRASATALHVVVQRHALALQLGGEQRAELAAALDVGVERDRVGLAVERARALPAGDLPLDPPLLPGPSLWTLMTLALLALCACS